MERMQIYNFGPIWGPIYCRKTKNIALNQNFWNILGISNNISPRSQKNQIILVKLTKTNFLGPNWV